MKNDKLVYFIGDDFGFYFMSDNPLIPPVLLKSNIIDGYMNVQKLNVMNREGEMLEYSFLLLNKTGTLFYSQFGNISNLNFTPIPQLKAVKVFKGYILTSNGQTFRYTMGVDGNLHTELVNTPVPFSYVEDFHFSTFEHENDQIHQWTAGLGFDGSVWVKGDNHFRQMGISKKGIYHQFVKLNLKNIKQITTKDGQTFFLDHQGGWW